MFEKLSILPGKDKNKVRENYDIINMYKNNIYSIVGYTGSGKSQLIQDIEQLAFGESIAERKILINDKEAGEEIRYDSSKKIVAHLCQNMKFVVDMQVKDFLILHGECRKVKNMTKNLEEVLTLANELTREKIGFEDNLTTLSGGQSRSLMIADLAINCDSPIVLIDELENAGIDRLKAMKILTSKGKCVIVVTHDPMLALMADMRIIMENGGVKNVLKRDSREELTLNKLTEINDYIFSIQQSIREGKKVI
jgi:ABC-type lipoprotein export system ATPase subunit